MGVKFVNMDFVFKGLKWKTVIFLSGKMQFLHPKFLSL